MELSESPESQNFYRNAAKYWENIPATVDGMLGGFGFITHPDIKGSSAFLKSLFESSQPPGKTYALDCGAGIGRITKNLLTKNFAKVDLVEQNPQFLESAKSYLENSSAKIGDYYAIGLQDFCPTKKYDVIWAQWILAHLNDQDLIKFLQNCIVSLKNNGLIVVKENVTSSSHPEMDKQDSSCTRPCADLEKIFHSAGLVCVKKKLQNQMPRGFYPIYMFALKPKNYESPEKITPVNSAPSEP